jgi:hypothetical protein
MFPTRQSSHVKLQARHGVSVPDSNRVCPMKVLYTQHLLQDSKLASGEEQGPARGAAVY